MYWRGIPPPQVCRANGRHLIFGEVYVRWDVFGGSRILKTANKVLFRGCRESGG
jgi:hypothetical protein